MNQIPRRLSGIVNSQYVRASHYIEDEAKHSITSEENKWIDYIHKEVIPSVQLYNSSSLGNLKFLFFCVITYRRLYSFMYDPLCSLNAGSRVFGRITAPYYHRFTEQYNSRKKYYYYVNVHLIDWVFLFQHHRNILLLLLVFR